MKVEIKKLEIHDLVKLDTPAVLPGNVGTCTVVTFIHPETQVKLLNR